jgi:hypothetical protein
MVCACIKVSTHRTVNSKGFNMTTFTFERIIKLERTLDRMANAAVTLSDSREQVQSIRDIQYLMAEVRMCSEVLSMPDSQTREHSLKSKAVDRLIGVFEQNAMPTDADYLAALGPCNK